MYSSTIRPGFRSWVSASLLAAVTGLLGLPLCVQAATVTTQYTGTLSSFFAGPFSGGETLTLTFEWDGTAPFDGQQTASRTFWNNAAENLVLDIDGYQATGSGYVRNLDNTTDDQMEVRFGSVLGTPYGTVDSAPGINGFDFYGLDLNFRSAGNLLFPAGDTTALLSGLANDVTADLTLRFRNQADQTFSNVINLSNVSFSMTEEALPLPGGMVLLMATLLPLVGRWLGARNRVFPAQ